MQAFGVAQVVQAGVRAASPRRSDETWLEEGGSRQVPLGRVGRQPLGQVAPGAVQQRRDGPSGDAHHGRRLFLLVPEGVDQDDGHALALGQAGDCGRDVDGDRRIGRQKGDHRVVRLTSLMTSLMTEILERPAGRDAAEPRLELRLVPQLGVALAGVEDRVLRDILGGRAGAEGTAQGRERTREIGIKRAIGGSRARVIRELVSEAGVIGLLGGLLGLGLGSVVVYLANEAGRSSGMILFLLTPQTAIFAVLFSTVLGVVAGIIPAWNAARLDPVAALRYE